jgi:hypothetical protein
VAGCTTNIEVLFAAGMLSVESSSVFTMTREIK